MLTDAETRFHVHARRGVVLQAHRDGLLGHEEAPAMAAISITSIVGAGSLGPEAPLVSIGGGLASLVSIYVDLSEAETLFVTMSGMSAGLGTNGTGHATRDARTDAPNCAPPLSVHTPSLPCALA